MLKRIFIFVLFILFTGSLINSYAVDNSMSKHYNLSLNKHDIKTIALNASGGNGRPMVITDAYLRSHFSYTTSNANEIENLVYMLNMLDFIDDGKKVMSADNLETWITITKNNGEIKKIGVVGTRFYDGGKQYNMDINCQIEFNRIVNFIYALKTEKICLDDEVTFEPSKWAKEDVEKAIENGLVPKWNRINYIYSINRLEVCQLIDSLLEKQSISEPESTENPFSDTADKSVTSLYSHGIIHGKTDNMFSPYDYVTREELAKILSNTYYLLNEKSQTSDSRYEYADQEEIADWALCYINDMYALDIMIGNLDNEFKPKDNVTKEELIIAMLRIYK